MSYMEHIHLINQIVEAPYHFFILLYSIFSQIITINKGKRVVIVIVRDRRYLKEFSVTKCNI